MQLTIMNAGQTFLTNLLSSNLTAKINSFRIAATANVTLDPTQSAVSGQLVYVGTPSEINYFYTSVHEITFVIKLSADSVYTDSSGNTATQFNVGNAMIYLDPDTISPGQSPINNIPTPFLWATLPQQAPKNDTLVASYIVGNQLLMHCSIWFPYVANALNLSNMTQVTAQFPSFSNETTIPSPFTAEYDQSTLDSHSLYDAACLTTKDNLRGLWWGQIFSQYIGDPRLGQLSGGIVTEPYGSPDLSEGIYYDASNYLLNNSQFTLEDGGVGWAVANATPVDGGAYTDTVFSSHIPGAV